MAHDRPFRLLDLPPELVGQTCEHLADEDLRSVRQVSRALKIQSTSAYGQRFFDHLIVILHPTSLTIFLEIARHPDLSKFVTRLSVSGERVRHSICPVKNQAVHEDLQHSMERSGADVTLLKEGLVALDNINTVRIDKKQFYLGEGAANHYPGVACGRAHILKDFSPFPKEDSHLEDGGHIRVYELTLKVLHDVDLLARVKLEFSFWTDVADYPENQVAGYFDLGSEAWKIASRNTHYVETFGGISIDWVSNILQDATDLHRLNLIYPTTYNQSRRTSRQYHAFSHNFQWRNLSHLRLEEVLTSHATFVTFLETHRETLDNIRFTSIGFQTGTWAEPLLIISGMSKLRVLLLDTLLERNNYPNPPLPDGVPDIDRSWLHACNRNDVEQAMKELCDKLATVPTKNWLVSGEGGECYLYMVDLRMAIAVTHGYWERAGEY
ncbi:hypothetical protein SLS59_001068 [Nothophoma quercina]|uniref:F-box domain-containing protein n=1 Tax=Nothophoma quercina TaxID=749835 RepID=A0ABR3RYX4_9PLEO